MEPQSNEAPEGAVPQGEAVNPQPEVTAPAQAPAATPIIEPTFTAPVPVETPVAAPPVAEPQASTQPLPVIETPTGTISSIPPLPTPPVQAPSSHTGLIVGIFIAIVLVLGGGGGYYYWLLNQTPIAIETPVQTQPTEILPVVEPTSTSTSTEQSATSTPAASSTPANSTTTSPAGI